MVDGRGDVGDSLRASSAVCMVIRLGNDLSCVSVCVVVRLMSMLIVEDVVIVIADGSGPRTRSNDEKVAIRIDTVFAFDVSLFHL